MGCVWRASLARLLVHGGQQRVRQPAALGRGAVGRGEDPRPLELAPAARVGRRGRLRRGGEEGFQALERRRRLLEARARQRVEEGGRRQQADR